jgi:hypothetical protein
MNRLRFEHAPSHADSDWVPFPGGELEGRPPRALCPECRARVQAVADGRAAAGKPALCFQCYRLDLERNHKIKAAGELDTASEARFQSALPFEPVNTSRLARLQTERHNAQARARSGAGAYIEKRRRAQIEARHALARILSGLKERRLAPVQSSSFRRSMLQAGTRAAELQLPDSWLPFVVSR